MPVKKDDKDMKFLIGQLKAAEAQSRVDWTKRQANIQFNEERLRILDDIPNAADALRLAALLPAKKVTTHKSRTHIPIRSQGTAYSNYTITTMEQRAKSNIGTNRPSTNLSCRTDTSKINSIVASENWQHERKF